MADEKIIPASMAARRAETLARARRAETLARAMRAKTLANGMSFVTENQRPARQCQT
jgi:hypothetical protein